MTQRWQDDPEVQADPALEAFLHGLHARADTSIDPAVRAATLEAMLATAATTTPAPASRASWGRRARRVLGLTGVKLALAAGVAAATTTGGLAATGSLPAPVQEIAHDLGRQVGIGIPAAPGQVKAVDETGRDHAPGQLKQSDGEPDTTGRDHAPGQQRGDDAPGRSGQAPRGEDVPPAPDRGPDGDDVPPGPQDDGAVDHDRVRPEPALPADRAPEDPGKPDDPGTSDDPGQPEVAPDPSGQGEQPAQPPPPPVEDAPAGAADTTTTDPAEQQPGPPDSPSTGQPDGVGEPQRPADPGPPADRTGPAGANKGDTGR